MKINIAAQAFSKYVADGIELLMVSGDPNFKDASATIEFIRIIDKLFDISNFFIKMDQKEITNVRKY